MGVHLKERRVVARVIVTNRAGELLLCHSRTGRAWVLPGGTLEPGEDLYAAAVREALEEAGVAVKVGALAYVQEFRSARRSEHVVEVVFRAEATVDRPVDGAAGEAVEPLGPHGRPWQAWRIRDVDGPVRVCRWFSREEVAALPDPVYPEELRGPLWEGGGAVHLGVVDLE
ncbi:8-oxo-dGTP pyrophosphatase MutT (NUDIX family) [Symbiobacterium terraclitae]|uniref:8-oxo-dGTP pyrophosphatase MutT (NUDIX family) n=1 Tax=Symbiobacterium terraclitae TaxID=557451 RepID=A0ABS4JRM8_9FIRM|nr:NUDIX hydrolase [Symbiobacterium terraclitae]MBP2018183.1 8-oxo-dGTP pyrophosphatase MutT (NUDIX family) [Symbiobacterium terraclitae]